MYISTLKRYFKPTERNYGLAYTRFFSQNGPTFIVLENKTKSYFT